VGLVAACAIVLQAMLSGVLAIEHSSPDPFSIICTGESSGDSGSQPRHNDHDCGACILTCGGATATTTPSTATCLPVEFFSRVRQLTLFEALPSPSHHQPQVSRAPPLSV